MTDNQERLQRIEADLTEVTVILYKFSQTPKEHAGALGTLQQELERIRARQERIEQSQERTQAIVDDVAQELKELAALVRGIAQGRINGRKET
jgi:DNA repair ATPase RecN